jgi:UDP-glucose 4-epimerase
MAEDAPGGVAFAMNILLTGAGGLIGRHLLMSAQGPDRIWALSRSATAQPGTAQAIVADLADPSFVDRLPRSIDTVVHLAQSSAYRDFPDGAVDVFDVNVGSTARLLDWGRRIGIERFVLASAGGAGRATDTPLAYYLASKRSAELLAGGYRSCFDVVTLRFHFVYGRGQRPAMLMPRLIDSVRSGRAISLSGADGIRITPTHVSDAVTAVMGAVRVSGSHAIDVGGPEVLSIRAIASTIGRKLGIPPVFHPDDRPADDVIADLSAMRALLGAPGRTLDAGMDDVLA